MGNSNSRKSRYITMEPENMEEVLENLYGDPRIYEAKRQQRDLAQIERRDAESANFSPPIRSFTLLEVAVEPYLHHNEDQGWVIFRDHAMFIRWSPHYPSVQDRVHKRNIERVAVEAALLKCQTEVEIRGDMHEVDNEGTKTRPEIMKYDLHLCVYFRKIDRKAHVYVGRPGGDGTNTRALILKRRGGVLPTVVLC